MKAEAHGARKFRDNRDTTGTAGQGPKFRDCPGHFGTVGNYGFVDFAGGKEASSLKVVGGVKRGRGMRCKEGEGDEV